MKSSTKANRRFFLAAPTPIVNKELTIRKGSNLKGRRIHFRGTSGTEPLKRTSKDMSFHTNGQLSIYPIFFFIKTVTVTFTTHGYQPHINLESYPILHMMLATREIKIAQPIIVNNLHAELH